MKRIRQALKLAQKEILSELLFCGNRELKRIWAMFHEKVMRSHPENVALLIRAKHLLWLDASESLRRDIAVNTSHYVNFGFGVKGLFNF
jgi:hypothetical protein